MERRGFPLASMLARQEQGEREGQFDDKRHHGLRDELGGTRGVVDGLQQWVAVLRPRGEIGIQTCLAHEYNHKGDRIKCVHLR